MLKPLSKVSIIHYIDCRSCLKLLSMSAVSPCVSACCICKASLGYQKQSRQNARCVESTALHNEWLKYLFLRAEQ